MHKHTIVVNATALDASGALGILRQFVDNIPVATQYRWLIFISDKVDVVSNNPQVDIVPISNVKPLVRRFLWDAFGVKRWLSQRKIVPIATISLQNTGFNCGYNVPNFIYYHQLISLLNFRWRVFNKDQRSLWFYKNIYPVFIRLFLRDTTEIFVQLEYIKDLFAKKFGVNDEKIHVISPTVYIPQDRSIEDITLDEERINLFYPATPFLYKNHSVLVNAIKSANNTPPKLYLTCNSSEIAISHNDALEFLGRIPYERVLSMYKSCDALVFPSYIETYGLPLIEAASLGVPIIAADLPYAREVLEGYDGVMFVSHDDVSAWAEAISKLEKGLRYKPMQMKNRSSWDKLFSIIDIRINTK